MSSLLQNTSNTSSVLQQGLQGMKASTKSMQEAATDIVRAGTVEQPTSINMDIVEPTVELIKQQHLFDANASVVKVADDIKGTTINLLG